MSNRDAKNQETWANRLASVSVTDQVDALRQICNDKEVTGISVAVVALSGSSEDEVRMWSAEALEVAVRPDPSEVPGLIELLKRAVDGEICYWAATMLGRLGVDAGVAVGALESCLRESMYLPARERAAWALSQIGPAASVAVPTLNQAVESAPPRLRRLASEAIRSIAGKENDDEIAA